VKRHLTLLRRLSREPDEIKRRVWAALSPADVRAFAWAWDAAAGKNQQEPSGDWRVWLLLAGRGFGKTRSGSEWILEQARRNPGARIALVGATLEEVARVMVEGESGLLGCNPPGEKLKWSSSRSELRFESGAVAHAFSGADGERLRGPQHHFAWADELGKWRDPDNSWDNLMMGMRLGARPRVLVTTTPGNTGLLKRIKTLPGVEVRGGRTRENVDLPPAFLEAIEAVYAGTRLGRQELDGELLEEADGALGTRDLLESRRLMPGPLGCIRVVVGVDPPATAEGDACGILVCGLTREGRGVVLADASCRGERPDGWARKVVAAADSWGAERVVAEANNGGDMVLSVLRGAAPMLAVKKVHATRGKAARAEPVAALFESGRCWLAGFFPELEDELTGFTPGGYTGRGSSDRADAMVWALSELMLGGGGTPMVRGL
jgi:phage terminase large subunit-like protein